MKIPYLDLSIKSKEKRDKLLAAVDRVLQHGRLVMGPEHQQFEEMVAQFCGTKYAVAVSSGTDALYLALRALEVGPGDEVITTPLSWVATTNAITLCGAKPVFVDLSNDLNLDLNLVEGAITKRTKAILPVHYTGRVCDMEKLSRMVSRRGVSIVEDAAQAYGASYNGVKAGAFGDLGAFSMNPMKILNGYGEAGVITTNRQELVEPLQQLRYAGVRDKVDCLTPSLNAKMDTIQAAMLLVEMEYLPAKLQRRREIANYFTAEMKDVVECPRERKSEYSVYYNYVIQSAQRDQLCSFLANKGVEVKIHYPKLIPQQQAYLSFDQPDLFPVAKRAVERIVSLPNHEHMSDAEVEIVVSAVKSFFL
jgi:dTDP-4-amino-4,6-dideoxygalactose transaminase